MSRLEKVAEKRFVTVINKIGGEAIKLGTMGPFGVIGRNDRLTLLPGKVVVLIEFKREGKKPTEIQKLRHAKYKAMGFKCKVAFTTEEALRHCAEALQTKALSKGRNSLRAQACLRRLLSSSRLGKDKHHPFHVQDTKESWYRRHTSRSSETNYMLRGMAGRGKEVGRAGAPKGKRRARGSRGRAEA
jgi:hypothetical protein